MSQQQRWMPASYVATNQPTALQQRPMCVIFQDSNYFFVSKPGGVSV